MGNKAHSVHSRGRLRNLDFLRWQNNKNHVFITVALVIYTLDDNEVQGKKGENCPQSLDPENLVHDLNLAPFSLPPYPPKPVKGFFYEPRLENQFLMFFLQYFPRMVIGKYLGAIACKKA